MSNLVTRILVGIVYIAFIGLGSLFNPIVLIAFLAIFASLCLAELIKILKFDNSLFIIGTVLGAAYLFYNYASNFWYGISVYELNIVNILPLFAFGVALIIIFKRIDELAYDSSKLIFSVVYAVMPFALLFSTVQRFEVNHFQNINSIICLFILLWCSDSFAYITGRLFGSTPLSHISKKKTVEGLIGGIFFTVVAGILINYNLPELRGNWIFISALVAIAAPIGDLAESKLKRHFQIKDSSNWMPGHGGYLDRLDSLLTSAVILYAYFIFI